jgi:hypothetical protein
MDINTLEEKLGIANLSDAEKLALVKGIESNVQASKAAVKAQEAGQYASLVVDAIKRIKNDLETRFNELNGIIDVKANSLQDGKDGLQGAKGEKGDRGFDGTNGKDGYNGKDGIDGVDGKDGVGVQDAYIDFDGSLIIKLTDGTEINVGEVVPMDVAEKIKIIGNGGGTSQSVLDSLESLQDQINTLTGIDGELGTMAQQDDTSVDINGGAIDGTTIGTTTAAAGTFTTLTAPILRSATGSSTTGVSLETPLGAQATIIDVGDGTRPLRINGGSAGAVASAGISSSTGFLQLSATNSDVRSYTGGRGATLQFNVAHTASAVNYVQVTGAATGSGPAITAQGSDTNASMIVRTKGTGTLFLETDGASDVRLQPRRVRTLSVNGVSSGVNYFSMTGATAGNAPTFTVDGSDTNIDLTLTPKGTGNVRFGTFTSNADTAVTGYITIKDSGGTVRKLAVIA